MIEDWLFTHGVEDLDAWVCLIAFGLLIAFAMMPPSESKGRK